MLSFSFVFFFISSLVSSVIHSSSGCLVAYFFSLHMFVDFAGFFSCSLFHSVVVGKMFDVISIFLNLLRLALWPRM